MKKNILLLLILFVFGIVLSNLNAQSVYQADINIKKLFENEQYYDIINQFSKKAKKDLSTEELIYVSWAYYMFGEVEKAKGYSDLAIKRNESNATGYYLKGLIDLSMKKSDEALLAYQKAIELDTLVGYYYTAVGNIYHDNGDAKSAIDYYNKGIAAPRPSEQAYYMLADTYVGIGDQEQALKAFYEAKLQVRKDKELYATILYNIGTMEMDKKNYRKAIAAFSELLEYFPDDYYTYASLVQCSYALKDYKIGDMYKDKLYLAYQNGVLTNSEFSDKFCIDNFLVGSKMISCYEYFQSTTLEDAVNVPIYVFYVVNVTGMIEAELQYNYVSDINNKKSLFKLTAYQTETAKSMSIDLANDQLYSDLKVIVENGVKDNYQLMATAKYRFE